MANETYLGPATVIDGKPVPEDGLSVNYSPEVVQMMRLHGHRFASDEQQVAKPSPDDVNNAVDPATGEADLAKVEKAARK